MKKQSDLFDSLLYSVGIAGGYLGYRYFTDAVFIIMEHPEKLSSIRKEVYLAIAQKNNTSLINVERNIRYIRDIMLKNGGCELLEEMTRCKFRHRNRPYPREVIEIFAKYLKQNT